MKAKGTQKHPHTNGVGLKVLGSKIWYGGGYCGVCGHRGEDLIPQAVRWWDCDDGWKMGVLCRWCGEECATEGPQPGDYAYDVASASDTLSRADKIDILSVEGDFDATYSEFMP